MAKFKTKRKRQRLPRVLKVLKQTGKRKSLKKDRQRLAMKSGKRKSKTGRVYYETRRNRSDLPKSSRT